ncbi:hypothetical protein ERX37_00140 [Macrococcus hajekii]|uniref:Uncharacterized protein n=1 Tax=Macrococcus hajekii TaxID=198482 RepID=A0A4R6BLG2_9STAP|nr:hypothetical protein [Macrococcus hajekii]TDM02541.1 hypothetical protein ERX37_00140 [Macrococcus hajekii]
MQGILGSVFGYIFALIFTTTIACLLCNEKRDSAVLRGNIISMIVSIILPLIMIQSGPDGTFFKPFGFVVFLTVVLTILQFVVGKVMVGIKKG